MLAKSANWFRHVRPPVGSQFQFGPNWTDFLEDILNFVAELSFLRNHEKPLWKHWYIKNCRIKRKLQENDSKTSLNVL